MLDSQRAIEVWLKRWLVCIIFVTMKKYDQVSIGSRDQTTLAGGDNEDNVFLKQIDRWNSYTRGDWKWDQRPHHRGLAVSVIKGGEIVGKQLVDDMKSLADIEKSMVALDNYIQNGFHGGENIQMPMYVSTKECIKMKQLMTEKSSRITTSPEIDPKITRYGGIISEYDDHVMNMISSDFIGENVFLTATNDEFIRDTYSDVSAEIVRSNVDSVTNSKESESNEKENLRMIEARKHNAIRLRMQLKKKQSKLEQDIKESTSYNEVNSSHRICINGSISEKIDTEHVRSRSEDIRPTSSINHLGDFLGNNEILDIDNIDYLMHDCNGMAQESVGGRNDLSVRRSVSFHVEQEPEGDSDTYRYRESKEGEVSLHPDRDIDNSQNERGWEEGEFNMEYAQQLLSAAENRERQLHEVGSRYRMRESAEDPQRNSENSGFSEGVLAELELARYVSHANSTTLK